MHQCSLCGTTRKCYHKQRQLHLVRRKAWGGLSTTRELDININCISLYQKNELSLISGNIYFWRWDKLLERGFLSTALFENRFWKREIVSKLPLSPASLPHLLINLSPLFSQTAKTSISLESNFSSWHFSKHFPSSSFLTLPDKLHTKYTTTPQLQKILFACAAVFSLPDKRMKTLIFQSFCAEFQLVIFLIFIIFSYFSKIMIENVKILLKTHAVLSRCRQRQRLHWDR